MVRVQRYKKPFKLALKKLKAQGKDKNKLIEVLDYIAEYGDAPIKTKPHNLLGNWKWCRDCHIEPDWVLIYQVFDEEVIFWHTWSHSELFK